jgi:hypothetical protein
MALRNSIKCWADATHGPMFELHRHYARQLFVSDLVTSPDDLRRVVITSLAAIASLGFLVPKLYYKKYEYLSLGLDEDLYRRAIYCDQLFLVVMTMLGIAALVMFRWDSVFPNRQDYLILRPLPLKLSQIYFAKLITLSALVLLVVALLTFPCAFSFASVISGMHDLAPAWREFGAQSIATFCAGIFVLFALASLQTLLMNLLPVNWHMRVSTSVQSLLLVGILCVIPWAVDLPNAVQWIDLRPSWIVAAPPLWYLCLYESLLGRADSFDHVLAQRGLMAMCAVLLATIVISSVSHQRYAKRIFESEEKVGRSRLHLLERLSERLAKNGRESAILIFTVRSIDRMKQHRMIRLVYAGVGCALVLESGIGVILSGALNHGRIEHGAALSTVFALPTALFFFLFTGLRYSFRLPVDLRANWVFRLTSPDAIPERERALRFMYFGLALLPAIMTTAPFFFFVLAPWRAVYGTLFACLIAALIIGHELENSDSIPLTCSYLPGKRNILHTGIIYWITVFLLTSVLTGLEALGAANSIRAALVIVLLAAIYWRSQKKETQEMPEIRFDDLPEPAVATLGLSRE